jgi:hypothetical protein
MRPIVISALMLSMASIFVSCENASQLTQNTLGVETPTLRKPPKDPKPPKNPVAELITFDGDLAGLQTVVGCCPNAGPFPEYTMTLSPEKFGDIFGVDISGEHIGNIFMNGSGRKAAWDYRVQFWWGEGTDDCYFIEIRGGENNYDKGTKILTVTFTGAPMEIIDPDGQSTFVDVTFTLTRAPQ